MDDDIIELTGEEGKVWRDFFSVKISLDRIKIEEARLTGVLEAIQHKLDLFYEKKRRKEALAISGEMTHEADDTEDDT